MDKQGILAPGDGILGAKADGGVGLESGTSFSTPVVTGTAALLLSRQKQLGQPIDPQMVRRALLNSAVPYIDGENVDSQRLLAGRLHVPAAIRTIENSAAPGNAIKVFPSASSQTQKGKEKAMPEKQPPVKGTLSPAGIEAAEEKVEPSEKTDVNKIETTGTIPRDLQHTHLPNALPGSRAAPDQKGVIADECRAPDTTPQGCLPSMAPIQDPGSTIVFALGQVSYDFGTEARMDYFIQQLGGVAANPVDPLQMADFIDTEKPPEDNHSYAANALIWTLNIDAIPVYAIQPENQFAIMAYARLIEFLVDQEKHGVERVSIAG